MLNIEDIEEIRLMVHSRTCAVQQFVVENIDQLCSMANACAALQALIEKNQIVELGSAGNPLRPYMARISYRPGVYGDDVVDATRRLVQAGGLEVPDDDKILAALEEPDYEETAQEEADRLRGVTMAKNSLTGMPCDGLDLIIAFDVRQAVASLSEAHALAHDRDYSVRCSCGRLIEERNADSRRLGFQGIRSLLKDAGCGCAR